MKYYELNAVPIKEKVIPFLRGYDLRENTKISQSGFDYDSFGSIKELRAMLFTYGKVSNLEFLPFLSWMSGGPNRAYILVVTPIIQKILNQFNMPSHKWYKIEVESDREFSKNISDQTYSMLQILRLRETLVDYSKSIFGFFFDNSREPFKILEKGAITAENHQAIINTGIESRQWIEPIQLFYHLKYDIIWGNKMNIVFSEDVKKAIESAGFGPHNGLGFKEFTDYQIIMPGE